MDIRLFLFSVWVVWDVRMFVGCLMRFLGCFWDVGFLLCLLGGRKVVFGCF